MADVYGSSALGKEFNEAIANAIKKRREMPAKPAPTPPQKPRDQKP